MAKKAAAPATITLKHLAAALAEEHDLSKKAAEAILTDMVGKIAKHLKKGERIRIVGLGILQVRKRAAARCLSVMVAGVAAFFAISGPPRWLNGLAAFVKPVRAGKTPRIVT